MSDRQQAYAQCTHCGILVPCTTIYNYLTREREVVGAPTKCPNCGRPM